VIPAISRDVRPGRCCELPDQAAGDARRDYGVAGRDHADRGQDVFQCHVLDQEPAGPGPQRAVDVVIVVEGGEHEHPGAGAGGGDQLGCLDAVHARHADVHDDHVRVLVLTTFDEDDYVFGALRAGASGFLVKDMALEDILTAIRVVAAGDAMISPGVTRRLIGQFTCQPRPGTPREISGITDREREVLRLVGMGMSNAEIAAALYITAGTAKTHVARLLAKLGARDRVQLVITAYEAGLVSASR
jgi:DNA-binding NarL/FixJ family response regulator